MVGRARKLHSVAMVADASMPWCELARFDDLPMARAVATSIAAMEFDVRLAGGEDEGPPSPYRVEVHSACFGDLADVLHEIIDEQVEFDRRLAQRGGGPGAGVIIFITVAGTLDIMVLLGLLDL